jgi:rhamnosyl/mannosyltransferase
LKNLAEGQVRAGHTVTVLCSADAARSLEETIAGVHVLRCGRPLTLFSQPLALTLPARLQFEARRADLVHLHSPHPLAEASALALPSRFPLAVSWHSDIIRQKALLAAYAPALEAFVRRANRIIVATPHHVKHSPILSRYPDRCEVVPYGVAPEPFEDSPQLDVRVKKLRDEHGRFLLFVGRLVTYKGCVYLIRALQEVPDVRLLIAGTGPLETSLRETTRECGLEDRITFLGEVQEEELPAYFKAAEALVLPSVTRAEAFGVVQIEAMAAGRPVVSTRLDSGVVLVNEDGVTGFQVVPSSPQALSNALRALVQDPSLRAKMGTAARARFEAHYSRTRMVEGVEAVYRKMLR